MKKWILLALVCTHAAEGPMSSTTDWWAFAGDSVRDGWEKNEQRFTKREVKDFRLLWQHSIPNPTFGVNAVLPPVVLGTMISHAGFKELTFVAASGNSLRAIDADSNRSVWEKDFGLPGKDKSRRACAGDLRAAPVFRPGSPMRRKSLSPLFVLTGDGMLRQLNEEDGSELAKPRPFVPAGVAAQPLNVSSDIIYTSTRAGCGQEAAVWSIDSGDAEAKPKWVRLGAGLAGSGGVVVDAEGRLFAQTEEGPLDPEHGRYGGTLVGLTKDLVVDQYFIIPDATGRKTKSAGMNSATPTAFVYKGTEFVVTVGKEGRLYVLKAADLGTVDHHHYISQSLVVPAMDGEKGHGIWGGISSWEDVDGSRYVLVPVWGPLSAEMLSAVPDTNARNGSIVAFKVVDNSDGAATLKPVWVSRDLAFPSPPVIAQGAVFALANGRFSYSSKGLIPRPRTHATLYAFDGVTGEEIYSTADQLFAAGNLAGLAIANGRVFFTTVDNVLQAFGKSLDQ